MITKSDFEIEDLIPDEFMPHLSVLKIYIRGSTDHVHKIYNKILEVVSKESEE